MTDVNAKKKILLVDDDETQLVIVDVMLGGEYEIHAVKSGKEALSCFLGGFIPDLILLDVLMPHMDGWEVFYKIRGVSVLEDVPIVFFTTVSEEAEKKRAFEMGAADYIIKPYKKDELMARLKSVLANAAR